MQHIPEIKTVPEKRRDGWKTGKMGGWGIGDLQGLLFYRPITVSRADVGLQGNPGNPNKRKDFFMLFQDRV